MRLDAVHATSIEYSIKKTNRPCDEARGSDVRCLGRYHEVVSTQTAPPRPVERTHGVRSWVIVIVTNLVSLICMAWVLNGAGLTHIWGEVRRMRWVWVSLAVLSNVLGYLLQAWRWKLLLGPVERVPFFYSARAIYVGLFANEVLPLRAGELIRCFLLSKLTRVPLSVAFASALIERIFDGVWLLGCFFFCLHIHRLPPVLIKASYILGIIIVICAIVIGCAMYARKQSLGLFFGLAWPRWFNTLIEDLHLIGHSRYLYFSFLVSGAFMLSQMLPIYTLVKSDWPGTSVDGLFRDDGAASTQQCRSARTWQLGFISLGYGADVDHVWIGCGTCEALLAHPVGGDHPAVDHGGLSRTRGHRREDEPPP